MTTPAPTAVFASTTAFSFWMSAFFSKSKTAAILGVLPYFGGYFISMALTPTSTRTAKLLACLHPSAAFTLAMGAFTEYEDAGIVRVLDERMHKHDEPREQIRRIDRRGGKLTCTPTYIPTLHNRASRG